MDHSGLINVRVRGRDVCHKRANRCLLCQVDDIQSLQECRVVDVVAMLHLNEHHDGRVAFKRLAVVRCSDCQVERCCLVHSKKKKGRKEEMLR